MLTDFSLIPASVIKEVLFENSQLIYKIVKNTYLAHDAGNSVLPGSYFLYLPNNPQARIIGLPGYVAHEFNIAGIKWIASNPKNLAQGMPRSSAVIILNNPDNGRPFACLEGSLISAARTAASAVLAAEYMSSNRKTITNLGMVGNGPIAREIYRFFMNRKWNIDNLILFDIQEFASTIFKSQIEPSQHKSIQISNSVEKLVQKSDVVVFATTTTSPYLSDLSLIKHCPLLLNISLRDLAPELLLNSHNIVDDISHVLSANTSPHLTQQAYGHTSFIDGTLAGLIQEKYTLTTNKAKIFSPMGLGILDLTLAKYIYDTTLDTGQQTIINNFFRIDHDSPF